MTLSRLPAPPAGYTIVTTGRLRFGDLAWNAFDTTWGGPTKLDIDCLGREIPAYYAVARRLKGA